MADTVFSLCSLQTPLPLTLSLGLYHLKLSLHSKQAKADHTRSAKRYERLMKFHGIHQSQSGGTTASTIRDIPVASPRKTSSPAGPSNKKRKLDNYAETTSNFNTDDDEGLSNVKTESTTTVKAEEIKEEALGQEGVSDSTDPTASTGAFQYPITGAMGFDGANDSAMFDDFLAFGGSIRPDHGSQAKFDGGHSKEESASVTPAIKNENGQGIHESILITD